MALVTIGVTGFDGKLLVLGGLLLLFGVGGLTGSLSQGEAAQAQTEDRSRQAKARMYDVLTGVLFAMTLLSLVGAAITQAAGFVALFLVSASLLGVAWIGYLVAALHGGKERENTARTRNRPGGVFESDKQQCTGSNRLRDPAAHLGGADEGTPPQRRGRGVR